MKILDGKKLNQEIAKILDQKIKPLQKKPCLAIIQVGNNSVSNLYIKNKINFAEKIGAKVELLKLDEKIETDEVVEVIKKINEDKKIHGVIVQMPLPKNINESEIFKSISKEKDVDGLSPENIYELVRGSNNGHVPATARGIKELLDHNQIDIESKKIVVIGRSVLAGKSIALNLLNHNATVTICHSKTRDLIYHTKSADIIIVAVGKKGFLTDEHLSSNQIIIDVGINSDGENNLLGDSLISNKEKLQAISPVPGGVGPMTVASLFLNLYDAYLKQA